ncbi:MAG: hypothetical protein FJW40_08325 [Acidobacteria bacterium]|nr:hypothetical protein [Acidobacteriota bacterium]
MIRYAFILVSAALARETLAQQAIQGRVTGSDGLSISGARVACGAHRTTTNTEGRFTMNAGRCQASISMEGFETRRLALAPGPETSIRLSLAPVTERVVVTALRSEVNLEEAGAAGNVITRELIEQKQQPMAFELLRDLPGLQVAHTSRFGGLTQVYTRGAQRTGTLVTVDGMPVNDPGGELNLAHYSTGDIDRVEVVRGPQSSFFGAEAAAGVIQLFTRRGDPEQTRPHGTLSYERGNFKTDRWIANLTGGNGGALDYSLTTEQLHTIGQFPNDAYRNTTGSGNIGYRIRPTAQLRGTFRSFDSHVGLPNRVAYGTIDHDAHNDDRDYNATIRLETVGPVFSQRAAFGYHRLQSAYTDRKTDGPYRIAALLRDVTTPRPRTYLAALVDPALAATAPPPPGHRYAVRNVTLFPFSSVTEAERANFDYQGTATTARGSTVFGYEFERQAGQISTTPVNRKNHGGFLHQNWNAGRLFLSGGARLEQNSVFGRKFTPRGAASFRLTPSTYLRASAGHGITEPTLLQSFAREQFFVGNPNLRLERTTTVDGGVVQEMANRRVRLEASLFHNRFQDLIVFVTRGNTSTWDNVERSRARGVEVSGQARLLRVVTVAGAYTRLWTRIDLATNPTSFFSGTGQELPRRAANTGSVSVSVAPRRWWIHAGAYFVGERQDIDNFGATRNPGFRNVYAGGAWRLSPHTEPFLRVDNLLNQRWQEILGYTNLGRSTRAGVRVKW